MPSPPPTSPPPPPPELTFIVHDRAESEARPDDPTSGMCGDINLFLMDDDASADYAPPPAADDEAGAGSRAGSSSAPSSAPSAPRKAAEVMVMIADPAYRRRGYAAEAVRAILAYASGPSSSLGLTRFVAKITESNAASLALFQGPRLGFRVARRMPHFEEIHLAIDLPVEEGGAEASLGGAVEVVQRPT
jgi:RimJ/RimL family protein N-acetyltransferase